MQSLTQFGNLRGGEASGNPKLWRNRRTQSYLVARNAFRDGNIVLAEDMLPDRIGWSEFEGQLCSIRTKPGSERVEDLVTKEEMLRDGIKSPDMADSLAMQFATAAPRLQPAEKWQETDIVVIESDLFTGMHT